MSAAPIWGESDQLLVASGLSRSLAVQGKPQMVVLPGVILPIILLKLFSDGCWWLDPKGIPLGLVLAGLDCRPGDKGCELSHWSLCGPGASDTLCAPRAPIFVQGGLGNQGSCSR